MNRPMPGDRTRATIVFFAIGQWDAADLQRFVAAIGAMYGLLLVCAGHAPARGEIAALFRRGVTLLDDERSAPPLSILDLLRPEEARDAFLRQLQLEYQTEPTNRLTVDSIQIADPGTAVFEGVGAVVAELRELIRELWSESRAERERLDLELQQQAITSWEAQMALRVQQVRRATGYLRGLERYRDLAGQSDERFLSQAAAIFGHCVEDLDDLVASGRLLEAPERLGDAD